MSFLADVHFEIESTPDVQVQKEFKSAYLTIISFLKFVDNGSSFTEKYLRDRFSHRLQYRIILDKLFSHSILKKSDEGNYVLNMESKNLISPVFDNSLFLKKVNRTKQNSYQASKFIYT